MAELESGRSTPTTLVQACIDKQLPIVVVQPAQVRQFAKAQGLLAKTDKLDARLIAQFGAVLKPEPRAPRDQNTQHFKDLLARKRQTESVIPESIEGLSGLL